VPHNKRQRKMLRNKPTGRRRKRGGRHRSGQSTQKRVEALLDRVYGRQNDYFDQRNSHLANRTSEHHHRGSRQHTRRLDIKKNSELFNRLVVLDFEYLMSLDLAVEQSAKRLLLPQSVLGRAQNGHGWFADDYGTSLCFGEATFDRVVTALEYDDPSLKGYLIRKQRSRLLNLLREYLLANLDTSEMSLEINGHGMLGVEFLRGRNVDTKLFFTGMVLAGYMDDYLQRKQTISFYKTAFDGAPLVIGGGDQYIVRPERLAACGIDDPGAVEFSDRDINTMHQLGIIVTGPAAVLPKKEPAYSYPEYDQVYFRRQFGDGVCDDLALIFIGARYGFDAMLGAFVMDAVDTYDKYLWTYSAHGFDTVLAEIVQQKWQECYGSPLVDSQQIFELIRFAAKQNFPVCPLSSSHRRLTQIERGANIPTVLNHWQFLQQKPVWDIALGFSRFSGKEFYKIADSRLVANGLSSRPANLRRCRKFMGRKKSVDNSQ